MECSSFCKWSACLASINRVPLLQEAKIIIAMEIGKACRGLHNTIMDAIIELCVSHTNCQLLEGQTGV